MRGRAPPVHMIYSQSVLMHPGLHSIVGDLPIQEYYLNCDIIFKYVLTNITIIMRSSIRIGCRCK